LSIQGRVRDVFLRGRQVVRDGVLAEGLSPGEFLPAAAPDGSIR